MLKQDVAQAVIAEALKTGGDFAEIFLEDRINHNLSMLSGKIESVNSRRLHGAGVRVFSGVRGVYVYTNDTSREGLISCARRAASAVQAQERTEAAPLLWQETNSIHPIREMPDAVKTARKAEKLRAAGAVLKEYDEIKQASVGYMDSVQRVWIANSEGLFTGDTRVYSRFFVNAIASNGTENQTGSCSPGAMQGFEIFESRVDPEKTAREAARQAVLMLHAPLCPSGVMPVVIDNGFGGVIFHEACGHSLEATSVAVGSSEFTGRLGEKIAADCVTAIDDGTMPNEWGSLNIDDEGTPTTRLVLIENGILKNYMIDKLNARRMHMPITGSGRRQGYMYAPTSRMRNTYDRHHGRRPVRRQAGRRLGGAHHRQIQFCRAGSLSGEGRQDRPSRAGRQPHRPGQRDPDEDRPGGEGYADGPGHVRLPERLHSHQRGPAHDPGQLHDRGRTLRRRMER